MKLGSKSLSFDYKWVIASICFLMVFTTLGFCSSNKSMYVGAITEATGIKRSLFSFNDSCRYISTAIVNIFFGSLIEKFGVKKLVCGGFLSLMISSLLYSVAENVALFYLGGIFLGVGLSFTTTAMVSCIVNRWFKQNRGTIMGAVLAANGLGGAVAAQIIYPIIYEKNNLFGYRNAYRLVALILFAVAVIVFIFLKEQPKNEPKTKTVVAKKKPKGEVWVGIEFSKAKKLGFFYFTLLCIFLTTFMLASINGVAATHMRDVKLDATYISLVLSIHSVALALSKFITGLMYDKLGLRVTTIVCSASAIIAMLSLFLLNDGFQGKVLAMIYGIISSLALPLETIMIPIFVGDLFGEKSFNKILGIFITLNTVGSAVGSPAINYIFDSLGSYKLAFLICGIMMVIVMIIMQFVITKAHKLRKEVLSSEESPEAQNAY